MRYIIDRKSISNHMDVGYEKFYPMGDIYPIRGLIFDIIQYSWCRICIICVMSCQELSNIYIESISWNVWSKTCQLIFKRIDCIIGKGSPLKKKGDTNTTEFIVLINYHIHHTKFELKKYSTLTTSISQDTVDAWNKQIRLMTANTYSPVTCCGMGQSTGIIL